MKIRTVLLAIAGTTMLSTAALAAADQNHPANRMQLADSCSVLESQYNGAIDNQMGSAKFVRAEGLGSTGTAECNNDEGTMGVFKLHQALIDLGVKPAA